jgi:hypothetical protein
LTWSMSQLPPASRPRRLMLGCAFIFGNLWELCQ